MTERDASEPDRSRIGAAEADEGRSKLGYWLRAAVSAGVLGFLLTRISGEELGSTLASADVGLALLAFALTLAAYGAGGLRLAMFVASTGHRARALDMVRVNLTAIFYTLVVPGGNLTAAVVRVAKMRPLDIPVVSATAALVRDRVDTTLALVLVGVVFLALDPDIAGGPATLALAVVAGLGAVAAFAVLESPVARGLDRIMEGVRFPLLDETIHRLWNAVRRTGRAGATVHLSAFSLSVATHLLSTLAYLALAHALGIDLSFTRMGWVRAGVLIVVMVPVTLGGIGLREAAFVVLLEPSGIGSGAAVALSLLVFAVTVLTLGLLGGAWDLADTIARGRRNRRSDEAESEEKETGRGNAARGESAGRKG